MHMAALHPARLRILLPLLLPAVATDKTGQQGYASSELGLADFDESAARLYLRYARVSFCDQEHVKAWDCGEDCEIAGIQPNSSRYFGTTSDWEIQGYVARLPEGAPASGLVTRCIVAIRGSVDIRNWIADALFMMEDWHFPTLCPDCRIHSGFAEAYRGLRAPIFEAVQDLNCTSLAFAGHSLGGALVTLASFEARAGFDLHVDEVWTFGKPRVGNDHFAKRYVEAAKSQGVEPPMWRIVHYLDPAPRVPWTTFLGYLHEPHEVWYTTRSSNSFVVCNESTSGTDELDEDPTCSISYSVLSCLGDPDYDHNIYLNMSMRSTDMSPQCVSSAAVAESVMV